DPARQLSAGCARPLRRAPRGWVAGGVWPSWRRGGGRGRPLERVEDDTEPELELCADAVAGSPDALAGEPREGWVLLGGELRRERLGDGRGALLTPEGQRHLLYGGPVDVGVEQGVGVCRHLHRDPPAPRRRRSRRRSAAHAACSAVPVRGPCGPSFPRSRCLAPRSPPDGHGRWGGPTTLFPEPY